MMSLLWTAAAVAGVLAPPIETAPFETYPGSFDRAPVLQWRVPLPAGPTRGGAHSERTRPVIVGDVILVGATYGEGLSMLSRRNGARIRAFAAKDAVEAEAVVEGDRVWFSDTGGHTWCYALTGALLWSYAGTAPILARPTLWNGKLIVADVDDRVVALDAATGELLWRYQAARDLTRAAELALYAAPAPVVAGEQVVVGFSDGSLAGIDARSGAERWLKRLGEGRYPDVVADVVATDSALYASGYYGPFVAFDLQGRNTLWRVDAGAAFPVAAVQTPDGLVLYHAGSDGKVRALSALTGAERWVWDSGDAAASLTTPQWTDAGLLVASSVGAVSLLDPDTGALRWQFSENYLLNGISSVPVVSGRQLLLVSNAGNLYSFLAPSDAR
jgi:outer membrane protein assembly factor BamB